MFRQPKNLTESLMPLFTVYAIIAHGLFRFPAHQQRPVFSVIYAIIITVLYLIALGFTLNFMFNQPWYGDDERIVLLIIYVNVGIATHGVILSWWNAKDRIIMIFFQFSCAPDKRFARIIKDLTKVDETLCELGGKFDYARDRNEGYGLIVVCIGIMVLQNFVDCLWFHGILPIGQIFAIASVLHHPVHINCIVAINFSVSVRLVGARYREANKILEGLKKSVQPFKVNAWENEQNQITVGRTLTISSLRTRQTLKTSRNRKCLIQIMKQVHLELGKIGMGFNEAYGTQMALEIAALFVMFTGLLYEVYILSFNPSAYGRHLRIFVIATWILIYFLKLIFLNEFCERVCMEARRTGEIIHCLDENSGDSELSNEISQFSLQLLHSPLTFSPAGLITLGHRFVKGFLSTVTTYLVILIQITPDK